MGEGECRWASTALRASGHLGTLKLAIGLLCFSMVALGVIVEFHPAGPQGRLKATIRSGDLAARAGGDEFVVVVALDDEDFSLDQVLRGADQAMYRAKRAGGNAVVRETA